jgi:RNA polymerase sigma factor (sigma-70 family)
LHARFTPLLRSRIRRNRVWPLLDGHMQVDDAAQEVWARAVPATHKGFTDAGPGSFLAFLGKIADRTLIDLARTARAAKRGHGTAERALQTDIEGAVRPKPGAPGPETPTSHARASELLQIARDVLSARELEAWELVELQRFTADEAGLAMRCSGAAIRGILLRSRAKLVSRIQRRNAD